MSNDKTPDQPSTHWREKVQGKKQAFNDNNDKQHGKTLQNITPASTTMPGANKETPKAEQPKTPTSGIEKKPSKFTERHPPKSKTPPPTPPKGPTGPRK